ncbi:MAG TPA: hypothetical protein VG347_13555 [Verrucomicrobiae bacterium]|nr:hypothetical protein [Verrucomicrobiae bacterium]
MEKRQGTGALHDATALAVVTDNQDVSSREENLQASNPAKRDSREASIFKHQRPDMSPLTGPGIFQMMLSTKMAHPRCQDKYLAPSPKHAKKTKSFPLNVYSMSPNFPDRKNEI